ncbi:MAG: AAA family ATPase [Candidatus Odinarchaeota archaeon]
MRFVGITGKMGAGKTTAARFVMTENEHFVLFRIAGKLKQIVQELDLPYTRDTLQRVATFFREIDHDIWVKNTVKEIDATLEKDSASCIVVDDVRFQNEVDFLRRRGFVIVRIKTSDEVRRERIERRDNISINPKTWKRWQEDPTEEEVEKIQADYEVSNDGHMNELLAKVQDLIRNAKS